MQQLFEPILEKDEEIVKVYRPNKCKFAFSQIVVWFLTIFVWIFPVPFFLLISPYTTVATNDFIIAISVTMGALGLTIIGLIVGSVLWYKKRYYAYTNRRVLIRSGIVGVDFRSLEYKSLTATVVSVSIVDKLVRKNTGTIKFGSPASPLLSFSNMGASKYYFAHIERPYEVLKEINEYMHKSEGLEARG